MESKIQPASGGGDDLRLADLFTGGIEKLQVNTGWFLKWVQLEVDIQPVSFAVELYCDLADADSVRGKGYFRWILEKEVHRDFLELSLNCKRFLFNIAEKRRFDLDPGKEVDLK